MHLLAALLLLTACAGSEGADVGRQQPAARLISPALWAGVAEPAGQPAGMPVIDVALSERRGRLRGPVPVRHPITGEPVEAYELVSADADGPRRLYAVTQGGASLGLLLDRRPGLPERRFRDDVVFPLGLWREGEVREFVGEEHTLLGPAPRRYRLEIIALDESRDGLVRALRYRLAVTDAAGRLLSCEVSVYAPGRGRVFHEARGYWDGCSACPCDG